MDKPGAGTSPFKAPNSTLPSSTPYHLLTDPFGSSNYPTAVLAALPSGASFARFDPSGRWVAGGRPDGLALVWALDTRAIVRYLDGHVKAVTSIECVFLPSTVQALPVFNRRRTIGI